MLRALGFIIGAAILLAIVWLIGTIPGTLTAESGGTVVQTSIPAAILILAVLALVLAFLFRILFGLRRAPRSARAWREGRKRAAGEDAVLRGMVAVAAGDAQSAAAEAGRAERALGEAPLALWLRAEAHRIAGRTEQAASALSAIAAHRQLGFLGHHATMQAALASGDLTAAEAAAHAGERLYPGAPSLRDARLKLAIGRQDWKAALAATQSPPEIAAFATGAARQAADRREALAFAKRAVKAAPAFAPAVAAYAGALTEAGKVRAARRALLAAWGAAPQPLIAQAWLAPFTTPMDRAREADTLAAANPSHPESALLLAETALAADLPGEARRHAEAARAAGLDDRRVRLIQASLDASPAARAAAETAPVPAWACSACGARQPAWAPVCANCTRPATLSWRTEAAASPLAPAPAPASAPPSARARAPTAAPPAAP